MTVKERIPRQGHQPGTIDVDSEYFYILAAAFDVSGIWSSASIVEHQLATVRRPLRLDSPVHLGDGGTIQRPYLTDP
jgi:hypothetical protein